MNEWRLKLVDPKFIDKIYVIDHDYEGIDNYLLNIHLIDKI